MFCPGIRAREGMEGDVGPRHELTGAGAKGRSGFKFIKPPGSIAPLVGAEA